MPTTTPKGYPYPLDADQNDVPADMQALAEAIDATPGIASMTTASRDALSGDSRWTGRVIWNTNASRLQVWTGSTWVDLLPPSQISHASLATLTSGDPHTQYLLRAGGVLNGRVVMNANELHWPLVTRPVEQVHVLTTSGTITLNNQNGTVVHLVVTGTTNIFLNDITGTNQAASFSVWINQDATGGRSVSFSGINWPDGQEPDIATGANQTSVVTFVQINRGGSTYNYGFPGGKAFGPA